MSGEASPRQWRRPASLPRLFWVLWLGSLVNRLGFMVQPFLALYLSGTLETSSAMVGVVLACFGAGAIVSQPLGGVFTDRYGPRPTLVWGMVASAATVAVVPFASGAVALAVFVTLYGIAVDIYRPALTALIVRLVASTDRARAFGLIFWAVNLGSAIAGMAGGVLAARGYWLLFAIDAGTCLVFALLAARLIPVDRTRNQRAPHGLTAMPWRDGLLWSITGTFLVFAVLLVQAYVTLPLVMRQDGLSTAEYGLVFAMNPLVILVVQPLVASRLSRWRRDLVYFAALTCTAAGFGLTGMVDTVPGYALTVLIWTLGEIGVATIGPVLVVEIAPAGMTGRYSGLFGTAFGASSLIGPLAGTLVLQHAGAGALWAGCAIAGMSAAAAVLAFRSAIERRTAAVASGG